MVSPGWPSDHWPMAVDIAWAEKLEFGTFSSFRRRYAGSVSLFLLAPGWRNVTSLDP